MTERMYDDNPEGHILGVFGPRADVIANDVMRKYGQTMPKDVKTLRDMLSFAAAEALKSDAIQDAFQPSGQDVDLPRPTLFDQEHEDLPTGVTSLLAARLRREYQQGVLDE